MIIVVHGVAGSASPGNPPELFGVGTGWRPSWWVGAATPRLPLVRRGQPIGRHSVCVLCVYPPVVVRPSLGAAYVVESPEEDAREDLEDETAEDDEAEEDWGLSESANARGWRV